MDYSFRGNDSAVAPLPPEREPARPTRRLAYCAERQAYTPAWPRRAPVDTVLPSCSHAWHGGLECGRQARRRRAGRMPGAPD